jgi:two-component system, sensor histidine kinase RegB
MVSLTAELTDRAVVPRGQAAPDAVALTWLLTVRWMALAAAAGAVGLARGGLDPSAPLLPAAAAIGLSGASNAWLARRVRRDRTAGTVTAAGALVCLDVVLLSAILLESGGIMNPAGVFYLVEIVLAALALGSTWTWIVTGLSVAGYATLFLTPTNALRVAQAMHPTIAVHMRDMWIAFALTAVMISTLVSRLALAVARRDRAIDAMRDRTVRAQRLAGLATLAAGAAHELSTPLGTMAVAAHELERALGERDQGGTLRRDAQLIRTEIDRCRRILDSLAQRSGEPLGQAPRAAALAELRPALEAHFSTGERERLHWYLADDVSVVWPIGTVADALAHLVRNALQASAADAPVDVRGALEGEALSLTVADRGTGMTSEQLARASEPFFTTKPPGAGTGLGLFVARSSIDQLGGTLTLTSAPREGTTASVTLARDLRPAGTRDDV